MLRARRWRRSSWIIEVTSWETCSGLTSVSARVVVSRIKDRKVKDRGRP